MQWLSRRKGCLRNSGRALLWRRRHSSAIPSCAGCVFQAISLRLNRLAEHIFEFVENEEADVVERPVLLGERLFEQPDEI
jgi:hypothetical protein